MLEFGKKHKRGKKTLLYMFLVHSWVLNTIGILVLVFAWSLQFGRLNPYMTQFLAAHPTWYIDTSMLFLWFILLGISFIYMGYVLASVHYRKYKFILDEHAVHLHQGFFFIREVTIPYSQISNVHIERPYTFRMWGIAKLDIVTAADQSHDYIEDRKKKFFIPIIDTKLARTLSHQLLECAAKARKGEDIIAKPHHEEEFVEEEVVDTYTDDDFVAEEGETVYKVIRK